MAVLKPGDIVSPCGTLATIRTVPEFSNTIGRRDSQLIFGETFKIDKVEGDFVHGSSQIDNYQGFIATEDIEIQTATPTHIVDIPHTDIYPAPDFKTHPTLKLSFMSLLYIPEEKTENGFIKAPNFGWVFTGHLSKIKTPAPDITETALEFLGTPYLYGGRSALGIDCSGLVQLSLLRAGHPCPRDSDQQAESVGASIENKNEIQRGDLIFFKGHVGIMIDSQNILNATARTMDVRVEKLSDLEKHYDGITAMRRIKN